MPRTEIDPDTGADNGADPPGRVFFPQARHARLWAQLPDLADPAVPAIAAALPAYLELRRAQTRYATLFRQLGEPLRLPRDPLRIYALARDYATRDRHWFLAQYGPDAGQPAALQLLGVDGDDPPRFLIPHLPRPIQADLPERYWRLRAWEVRTVWDDAQAHIRLSLDAGRLELTAEAGEIVTLRWNPAPKLTLRWEQSERGDAVRMLGRRRNPETARWKDDQLFAPGREETPLALPTDGTGPLLVGRVAAVDQDPGRPHRVWFGNNRARVHGLDLADPAFLQSSPMLAGTVSDLLLVSPRGADPVRLLTLCSDGIAYLLEADLADPTRLRPLERCFHDVHLAQLFPLGQGTLLGLDRDLRLWPLHLADPVAERDQLAAFVTGVWRALGLGRPDHPLWQAPADLEVAERDAWATLALDYCLAVRGADCYGGNDPLPAEGVARLVDWLVGSYQGEADGAADARARLHGWLLERLWDWCDGRPVRTNGAGHRPAPPDAAVDLLFKMLTPHADAPDWLWQRVLRDSDRLEPWIRTLVESAQGPLRQRYRDWRRVDLQPAWHMREAARGRAPLWLVSSTRLGSRPRHIRVVDAQQGLVALVEYEGGLSLWRCPASDQDDWTCHARLPHDQHWRGLPRALAAGDRLREVLGVKDGWFVLVATDRGELRLFRVDPAPGRSLTLIWRDDLEMDVRCCTFGSGTTPTLLLGGADAVGRACIRRLRLHGKATGQWQPTYEPVWNASAPGGLLRMLGKARLADGQRWLWAADRFGGTLYRWPVDGDPPRLIKQGVETLLRGRKDLHTFALDRDAASQLAVCGGRDALAFAFDRGDGALRWVVGCNRGLTRAVHLGGAERGQWLLCTDHVDAMLVDEAGTPNGALLGVGPVTAARLLDGPRESDGQRLLIGDRGGRLLLLRSGSGSGSGRAASLASAPDRGADPGRYLWYPLRTDDPIDAAGLPALIDLVNRHREVLRQDHLCAQDVLFAIWDGLERHGLGAELVPPLADLLRNLANIVLVPVIRPKTLADRLRTHAAERKAWLGLFARVWQDIARRNREDNLCHQARVLSNLPMDRFVEAERVGPGRPATADRFGPRCPRTRPRCSGRSRPASGRPARPPRTPARRTWAPTSASWACNWARPPVPGPGSPNGPMPRPTLVRCPGSIAGSTCSGACGDASRPRRSGRGCVGC